MRNAVQRVLVRGSCASKEGARVYSKKSRPGATSVKNVGCFYQHRCAGCRPRRSLRMSEVATEPASNQDSTEEDTALSLAALSLAAGSPRTTPCEEETEEERCWVCLEGERKGPLVQLCACRGSSKWSHRACVEYWRRNSDKEDAAYRCGTCKDHYRDALSLELLSARLQAERTDGEDTCYTLDALASELQVQGKYDRAEPLFREALGLQREALGDRHPGTLISINNLGSLLQDKGDLAAAEPLLHETLKVYRETLGNRHPDTLISINNLGSLLFTKGDLAAAELLCREAVEVQRATLGNGHPNTLTSISNLGLLLEVKALQGRTPHR